MKVRFIGGIGIISSACSRLTTLPLSFLRGSACGMKEECIPTRRVATTEESPRSDRTDYSDPSSAVAGMT